MPAKEDFPILSSSWSSFFLSFERLFGKRQVTFCFAHFFRAVFFAWEITGSAGLNRFSLLCCKLTPDSFRPRGIFFLPCGDLFSRDANTPQRAHHRTNFL